MIEVEVTLTRPALKQGGDRYEAEISAYPSKPWVVYIPQIISREKTGTPAKTFVITLEAGKVL